MTILILNRLHESGDLRSLVLSGIVSVNVLEWRKMYNCYQDLRLKGVAKYEAIRGTADVHGTSYRTVYRVIEKFKHTTTNQKR
jgi:hypothetical protein